MTSADHCNGPCLLLHLHHMVSCPSLALHPLYTLPSPARIRSTSLYFPFQNLVAEKIYSAQSG
jgi:hypothetical protein